MVNCKIFSDQTVKLEQKEVKYFTLEILVKHFTNSHGRDHIDRPATPNSLPSLIRRASTSNTIFNARDGVSPLQVKHRNCNLCLLMWFFFFAPKRCRFGYVLYKSLPLGPIIQKFYRSPPVSCKFGLLRIWFFFLGCKSVFFFL